MQKPQVVMFLPWFTFLISVPNELSDFFFPPSLFGIYGKLRVPVEKYVFPHFLQPCGRKVFQWEQSSFNHMKIELRQWGIILGNLGRSLFFPILRHSHVGSPPEMTNMDQYESYSKKIHDALTLLYVVTAWIAFVSLGSSMSWKNRKLTYVICAKNYVLVQFTWISPKQTNSDQGPCLFTAGFIPFRIQATHMLDK